MLRECYTVERRLILQGRRGHFPVLESSASFADDGYKGRQTRTDDVENSVMKISFAKSKDQDKENFLDILRAYTLDNERRRSHVEFLYAAMKYMEQFNVHMDLEMYKKLIDVLPKGKYIAMNQFQVEFMHYPKEQQCIIDLLQKMEDNAIIPDVETEEMLINIFGNHSYPLRKLRRMAYWMPKFRNLNPWPPPIPLPEDSCELAKVAIKKICSVDVQSHVTVFQSDSVEDSVDKTWIVSGMSPMQEELLVKHDRAKPVFVEGPFKIWVGRASVDYFILRADAVPFKPPNINIDDVSNIHMPWEKEFKEIIAAPSVHEQAEGTLFSVCATGTSSKDSLLSWVRCLERKNPVLVNLPIVFTLSSGTEKIIHIEGNTEEHLISPSKADEHSKR
ncbi:evolutionarily conserved signaling intermediate in Toll pathway, mitochondrial isoform X2 [Orussus abietinus]|nr:evolutionarily conserved signaling intermediate in Toll pathway, mitochondrial isoform X2 [Orussus abietinus]